MIEAWLAHLQAVRDAAAGVEPALVTWSPAEQVSFERAYNAARTRHADRPSCAAR